MTIIRRNEEFIYRGVNDGLFELYRNGEIWRIAAYQINRWTGETYIRECKRHRAEADNGEYFQIHLMCEGKKAATQAQRLLWRHFKGPIPDGLTINHKNGDKKDNRLRNLELATRSEQQFHAIRVLGYRPHFPVLKGAVNGRAKLCDAQIKLIRMSDKSCTKLAGKFGVSIATISSIRNRRTWGHI